MGYLTIGVNHKTAPVSLREKIAFSPEGLTEALKRAQPLTGSREVAILSTCNRTELYCAGTVDQSRVLSWLANYHSVDYQQLLDHTYCYQEQDAIRHMMRVACGLDSLVLGEPQILGQLKSAYAQARAADTVGPLLSKLFQQSFSTAKQVRTDTAIGKLPVSVAYSATQLARQIFSDLSENTALLIGAGETIQLVARHLQRQGLIDLIIANRTLVRAKQLTAEFGGRAVRLSDLPEVLHEADIVISSTASPIPVLGKGCVERALKARKRRVMFMVDIAVPRDIEPEVGSLSDVFLYTVDDLEDVINENRQQRKDAADLADTLIESDLLAFTAQLRELDAVHVLRAYRENNEALRNHELRRSLQELARGVPPEKVLAKLAHTLTNKMMHAPSVQLKKAAAAGQHERLAWAKELLAIELHEPVKKSAALELDAVHDRL